MLISEGPRSGVHINHRQQRNLFQIRCLESGPPEQDDRSHPSPTSHVRVVPYRGHRPLLGLGLRGDPALAGRTWVLLTEAVPGGWGLRGHANTNDELIAAARKQIAELQAKAAGAAS